MMSGSKAPDSDAYGLFCQIGRILLFHQQLFYFNRLNAACLLCLPQVSPYGITQIDTVFSGKIGILQNDHIFFCQFF